jgi:hypothetical protein
LLLFSQRRSRNLCWQRQRRWRTSMRTLLLIFSTLLVRFIESHSFAYPPVVIGYFDTLVPTSRYPDS